mmetsp:Transcript_28450/g.28774  ORF Transcript_28450/g.28774 Transcript_28450/m.28774 type:complete len:116 (+) Transcript_28450:54-401(+)
MRQLNIYFFTYLFLNFMNEVRSFIPTALSSLRRSNEYNNYYAIKCEEIRPSAAMKLKMYEMANMFSENDLQPDNLLELGGKIFTLLYIGVSSIAGLNELYKRMLTSFQNNDEPYQ